MYSKRKARDRAGQIKMHDDRLSDVRETVPFSDGACIGVADGQNGHLLARVVGAAPSRIAAVVRRDHHKILILKPLEELGQPAVELLKRKCITGGVAPMTIDRVEINEVGEQQSTVLQIIGAFERTIEQRIIPRSLQDLAGA